MTTASLFLRLSRLTTLSYYWREYDGNKNLQKSIETGKELFMPINKSAKKRVRQNSKCRMMNRSHKSALKTQIKKFVQSVQARNMADAEKHFSLTTKRLDQIAAKGIIHKKTASRKKSRLAKVLNKLKTATP
ncbi:MAG: 30S ribosomal protein S20 [Candidatus Scalindua sp.]|nr:30S ribosomal protein S20 [Candidatus Scalindua sp.]